MSFKKFGAYPKTSAPPRTFNNIPLAQLGKLLSPLLNGKIPFNFGATTQGNAESDEPEKADVSQKAAETEIKPDRSDSYARYVRSHDEAVKRIRK